MKKITITEFLTQEEIEACWLLYRTRSNSHGFARRVHDTIILPNMERINKALGQENDAMYLAYAVEYVMDHTTK
jgi:hypothetical protein